MIYLREIEYKHLDNCINLEHSDNFEVNCFVEKPIYMLAESYVLRHEWVAYGIFNYEEMVGIVRIRNKPVDGNKPYGFSELFIADNHKRKGYGSKAVKAILEKLKNENGFKTIKICVHEENNIALDFYIKIGFISEGRTSWSNDFIELSIAP